MLSYIIKHFVYEFINAINLNLDHCYEESSDENAFVDALTSQEPTLCEVEKISEEKST